MQIRRAQVLTTVALVVGGVGCKRKNPDFCCLTAEDCQQFDVSDGPVLCEAGRVCTANECTPAPDAGVPDANVPDACTVAGGQIVFQTDRHGETEIARILADGTGYQRLTSNAWRDEAPHLSPDGRKIAWISYPAGVPELFIMNWDGSDAKNVSNGAINPELGTPRWAPDGSAITFDRDNEIHRVSADGTNPIVVASIVYCTWPDWSPDGSHLVFNVTQRLYVVDSDGTNPHGISALQSDWGFPGWGSPRWSPNGGEIVANHEYSMAPYTQELMEYSATGIALGQVIDHLGYNPAWSPDGSILAFDYNGDVMTATPAGAPGATSVTTDPADDQLATWSPDGSRLLFQSDRSGDLDVFAVNPDGSGVVNLSANPSNDASGSWARCPQ